MSMAQIAAALGIHERAWRKWETGEAHPSSKSILHVAKKLSLDPLWLMAGPGSEPVAARGAA